jgi:hypothetical protein
VDRFQDEEGVDGNPKMMGMRMKGVGIETKAINQRQSPSQNHIEFHP